MLQSQQISRFQGQKTAFMALAGHRLTEKSRLAPDLANLEPCLKWTFRPM
jgi:hypothetical protein